MNSVIRDVDDRFVREKYLGKGAFSRSYILKNGGEMYCGKFIAKNNHYKSKHLENLQEFRILRKLNHPHIVNFVKCVETPRDFCLIMEYYPNKSMFELIQRRGKLTIYEVRFFSKQLLSALSYLHDRSVIHRDVKPQNMLLDANVNLKLSDFGMAVTCPIKGHVYKIHVYGTPNYISPEMITKSISWYNYKVDIWAVGCFLHHSFTGRTPFRGRNQEELYKVIQSCAYTVPADMPQPLSTLVQHALQKNPNCRPNTKNMLSSEFFSCGFTPDSLPLTALVEKPKFMVPSKESKGILLKPNTGDNKYCENKCLRRNLKHYEHCISQILDKSKTKFNSQKSHPQYYEIEYPMLDPLVWIIHVTKHKRHVGYKLNDGTKGVLYDDKTVLVLLPKHKYLYYVTSEKLIKFYTCARYSDSLKEKVKLLQTIFELDINGGDTSPQSKLAESKDWLPMLPYLVSFYETTKYYVLLLSNGLYEMISKLDNSKLLLCTKTSGFSVMLKSGNIKTYDLNSLFEFQYPECLHKSLQVTYSSLKRVLMKNECFACKKEVWRKEHES